MHAAPRGCYEKARITRNADSAASARGLEQRARIKRIRACPFDSVSGSAHFRAFPTRMGTRIGADQGADGGSDVGFAKRGEPGGLVHEALWWMSYNCRVCGVGKWYCQCQWDSDSDGEEGGSDESWMTDGTEWETDSEDEEQNGGLATPAEKNSLKPKNISPEDATATKQAAGKRMLFVEGK